MSPVAQRIFDKMNRLIKERDDMQSLLDKTKHATEDVKKRMHRTELLIAVDGSETLQLASELRELNKEKNELHADEQLINDLAKKYQNLSKAIEDHRFWMRYADSADPARQREAEKRIFG